MYLYFIIESIQMVKEKASYWETKHISPFHKDSQGLLFVSDYNVFSNQLAHNANVNIQNISRWFFYYQTLVWHIIIIS